LAVVFTQKYNFHVHEVSVMVLNTTFNSVFYCWRKPYNCYKSLTNFIT